MGRSAQRVERTIKDRCSVVTAVRNCTDFMPVLFFCAFRLQTLFEAELVFLQKTIPRTNKMNRSSLRWVLWDSPVRVDFSARNSNQGIPENVCSGICDMPV